MESSDQPREKTVSEAAVMLDDVTRVDLRQLADRLLETTRVEYVDDGVLLVMNPPAPGHRAIVRLLSRAIDRAFVRGGTPVEWTIDSENFQWELPGQSERFYVPDIVVSHPGARTPEEERAATVLVDQERTAWTLFSLGEEPGYQVLAAGKFGESVPLPAPLGFSIPTTEWPT